MLGVDKTHIPPRPLSLPADEHLEPYGQNQNALKALQALLDASDDDISPELMKKWDGLQKIINISREYGLGDGLVGGLTETIAEQLEEWGYVLKPQVLVGRECYWLRRLRRIERNARRRH